MRNASRPKLGFYESSHFSSDIICINPRIVGEEPVKMGEPWVPQTVAWQHDYASPILVLRDLLLSSAAQFTNKNTTIPVVLRLVRGFAVTV